MDLKNIIGKRIKERRVELGITQRALCKDYMSRNMLSLIENGKAFPSLECAQYIANELGVPIYYLFTEKDDISKAEKLKNIEYIRELFCNKNYSYCIKIIESLHVDDDEINMIYALCSFYHGIALLKAGSLLSSSLYLKKAIEFSRKTIYPIRQIEISAPLYIAIADNIQSPLLELDTNDYLKSMAESCNLELFKYITPDLTYNYNDPLFKAHIEAKALIKKYLFNEAIPILHSIEDQKSDSFNALVLFGVYTDLENCYKQLGDFENAYRYSSKRLSLLNAFKT